MKTPFFASRADRVSLAKKQYIDEGVLPTGLVSDAVFQSWARCYRSHQNPDKSLEFEPVSQSRTQLSLQKNRVLHDAWLNELPSLTAALGSARCSAILTDATGVLIGASPLANHASQIIPTAHRVGVNLSEAFVGTTAPSIVARTGKAACVLGAEHFYESVRSMYCTAAPIHNTQGQLAGIFNISSEGEPFHFDPASVVSLYAASIENRFLIAQSREHLIVKFQFMPSIVDTPMAGILCFDLVGKLVWTNSLAANLLGIHLSPEKRVQYGVEGIFATQFAQLASLAGHGVTALRLNSGVQVFLKCELSERSSLVGTPVCMAVGAEPYLAVAQDVVCVATTEHSPQSDDQQHLKSSLKEADAELIKKYLVECKGNISQVAKRLQVSRGLVYRRLQKLGIGQATPKKRRVKPSVMEQAPQG
jgi:sigma-54 dependent transcriptional regulator, acetoin dehydrogenase operon transcriptional activator AcoR